MMEKKLYYILVLRFSGAVEKTASWKIKNGSYFPNHQLLIWTLNKILEMVVWGKG